MYCATKSRRTNSMTRSRYAHNSARLSSYRREYGSIVVTDRECIPTGRIRKLRVCWSRGSRIPRKWLCTTGFPPVSGRSGHGSRNPANYRFWAAVKPAEIRCGSQHRVPFTRIKCVRVKRARDKCAWVICRMSPTWKTAGLSAGSRQPVRRRLLSAHTSDCNTARPVLQYEPICVNFVTWNFRGTLRAG